MDTTLQVCNYYFYFHSKCSEELQFFCSTGSDLLFGHAVLLPQNWIFSISSIFQMQKIWKFHWQLPSHHTPKTATLQNKLTLGGFPGFFKITTSSCQLLHILIISTNFSSTPHYHLNCTCSGSQALYMSFSKNISTILLMVNKENQTDTFPLEPIKI